MDGFMPHFHHPPAKRKTVRSLKKKKKLNFKRAGTYFLQCHMRNLLTPIACCRWCRKELPNW